MTHDKRTRAEYQACADAGKTRAETARYLGVKISTVNTAASRHKLTFAGATHGRNRKPMVFEGVTYPSQTEAAKVAGVARASLMARRVPQPRVKVCASPSAIARALVKHGVRA